MIGYGNSVFLRTAWEVSGGVSPVNTVAPAITGTAQEGQTVTCSTGTWTGTPTITFAYQWKRNGSNIGSATNSTYTLVTADVSQSITCQVTATNGSGSASATSNTITAAAITNPTQQAAINTLVVDLKGYSIWTKMKALYPFVGSSSSSNSYNLKNTAQYQLSFSGGGTWNSNGYTGGVNGYANTGLNPNTAFSTNNSMHLSLYSRTNNSGGFGDFGILNASALTILNVSFSGNASTLIHGGTGVLTANTNSTGFYVGTRTSASVLKLFKNNTQLGSTYTGANGARGDLNMFLGALNVTGTAQYYTQRNYAFASIGDGLTDTEAANFYTAVQAFQTTLGRQV